MARMGRPRQFDRDAAVLTAMHLFWEHGYESTSLSQLKAALGISAPSFYAAFGSKEALFQEAVACYLRSHAQVTECLWDTALAPRAAIALALRRSAAMQCESGHPAGCMVALGVMSANAPGSEAVVSGLTASRTRTRAGILGCVERAVAQGEFGPGADPAALAMVFDSFLLGLSTLARDGVTHAQMESAITTLLGLWDRAAMPN